MKAFELLDQSNKFNTINHTKELEDRGQHPYFTSRFWVGLLSDPKSHKPLVARIEKQAKESKGG